MSGDEAHWQQVYGAKDSTAVSWYRPHLTQSLAWIDAMNLGLNDAILDVGGGASTLVDDLLERGFRDVSVLDLSARAMEQARARLGERDARVRWLVGDVTTLQIPAASVRLWHDRAVLHFLSGTSRDAYLAQIQRAVAPGGAVILATFAPDGPERCSGLPVTRYAPAELASLVGPAFELVSEARDLHITPWGSEQSFTCVWLRRVA